MSFQCPICGYPVKSYGTLCAKCEQEQNYILSAPYKIYIQDGEVTTSTIDTIKQLHALDDLNNKLSEAVMKTINEKED